MSFYERYEKVCKDAGLFPAAQATAEKFGINRANATVWKKNGRTPNGDVVAKIAEALHISSDYLLGLTDDPNGRNWHEALLSGDLRALNLASAFQKLGDADKDFIEQMVQRLIDEKNA